MTSRRLAVAVAAALALGCVIIPPEELDCVASPTDPRCQVDPQLDCDVVPDDPRCCDLTPDNPRCRAIDHALDDPGDPRTGVPDPGYCERSPSDYRCSVALWCGEHPDDPRCAVGPGECWNDPLDPRCAGGRCEAALGSPECAVRCDLFPGNAGCACEGRSCVVWCETHPTDPACQLCEGPSCPGWCESHPGDPACAANSRTLDQLWLVRIEAGTREPRRRVRSPPEAGDGRVRRRGVRAEDGRGRGSVSAGSDDLDPGVRRRSAGRVGVLVRERVHLGGRERGRRPRVLPERSAVPRRAGALVASREPARCALRRDPRRGAAAGHVRVVRRSRGPARRLRPRRVDLVPRRTDRAQPDAPRRDLDEGGGLPDGRPRGLRRGAGVPARGARRHRAVPERLVPVVVRELERVPGEPRLVARALRRRGRSVGGRRFRPLEHLGGRDLGSAAR